MIKQFFLKIKIFIYYNIVYRKRKALNEFLKKYPEIELEEWKNYSIFGKSFLVKKV